MRMAILERAETAKSESGFYAERSQRVLCSLRGVAYLLWLAIRKQHPDFSREATIRLLNEQNLDIIKEKLDEVNGLHEDPHHARTKSRSRPGWKKRNRRRK
jgi:hypothetical protein